MWEAGGDASGQARARGAGPRLSAQDAGTGKRHLGGVGSRMEARERTRAAIPFLHPWCTIKVELTTYTNL